MLQTASHIISHNGGLYVAGMAWKESASKTVKAAAKEDALALIDGSDEGGVRSCYSVSESSDKKSASYGLAMLAPALDNKKTRSTHSLAASLALQSEDGLYVALVTPVDTFGSKGSQVTGDPLFWIVGISGGVVIPRTDLLFANLDEVQSNLSMLRAFAPDLPVFVDGDVDSVFLHDQQSWVWPASMPGNKSRPVAVVGGGLANSSLLASNAVKAGIGLALISILAGAGYMGWGAYQDHLARQAPDPAVLALQQQQAYEARLQEIAAQFSDQALGARWSHVWSALEVARIAGPSGGYRLSAFSCDVQSCQAEFLPVEGLVSTPGAVQARLQAVAQGIAVQENTAQRLMLTWAPPAPALESGPSVDQAVAWAASRPARSDVDAMIQAMSRPTALALNSSFRVAAYAPGQSAGAAMGVDAVSVIAQTDVVPVGATSLNVLSVPLQIDALALQGWMQTLAQGLQGRPAGLRIQFNADGVASLSTVQVISVVRI